MLSIVWYIKVELLCTQQLPPYITLSQFHKVPLPNRDIDHREQNVYNAIYYNTEKNNSVVAGTGSDTIDGRFGTIMLYDAVNCQVDALVSPGSVWKDKNVIPMTVHMQNMGRLQRVNLVD